MPLPNFLIIGTAKAATTSLHSYLAQHPEVCMSLVKETNFFAWNGSDFGFPREWHKREQHEFPAKTLEEYGNLFRPGAEARVIGEASPLYLDSPHAPGRIHQMLPGVKLIVTLRRPVDRVISNYKMLVRMGVITETIEESLRPGKQLYELSFVGLQLERYFRYFPRERFLFVRFEDLQERTEETLRDIWHFLGVREEVKVTLHPHNRAPGQNLREKVITSSSFSRNLFNAVNPFLKGPVRSISKRVVNIFLKRMPEFPADLRERIQQLYAQDVLIQEKLTGLDLSAWR